MLKMTSSIRAIGPLTTSVITATVAFTSDHLCLPLESDLSGTFAMPPLSGGKRASSGHRDANKAHFYGFRLGCPIRFIKKSGNFRLIHLKMAK